MELFKKIVSVVVATVVASALIYGLYWLALELFTLLAKLQNEVLAALIGAMATVLAGITAVIISQKQSKQRDIDESHRSKKSRNI